MNKEEKKLREEIGSLQDSMKGIINKAKDEDRALTEDERADFDSHYDDIQDKKSQIEDLQRAEKSKQLEDELTAKPVNETTDTDVKVNGHKAESEQAMYHHTAKMLRALTLPKNKMEPDKRANTIKEAQKELYKGGHYGGFKASVEAFSTLTDTDGGIFLPTSVSDQIMEIEREYGAFPANAMSVPLSVGGGRQILPNMLGEITFHAVNQGSEANASRFTFNGIALEDRKWMAFVPWTNDMGAAAGERLVQLIMRKLGEASAGIKDDTVINANGTSTYHGITGLVNRSDDAGEAYVRKSTAATGNASFASVDEDDFLNATLDVAPSIRSRGIFVLHTDWKVRLAKIKDNEGRPLYLSGGAISRSAENQWTIYGHRVVFTEKAPNTDGASADYGIFCNPSYLAFGDVGMFSAEELTEATIKDENGSDIRLASQDMRALRVKEFFDVEFSQLTISSGGNDLGAFTVLETAST